MTIKMTYKVRVGKIKKSGDVVVQLKRARNYVKTLNQKCKKLSTLDEKLECHKDIKEAEKVSRKIRQNSIELEWLEEERGLESIKIEKQEKAELSARRYNHCSGSLKLA